MHIQTTPPFATPHGSLGDQPQVRTLTQYRPVKRSRKSDEHLSSFNYRVLPCLDLRTQGRHNKDIANMSENGPGWWKLAECQQTSNKCSKRYSCASNVLVFGLCRQNGSSSVLNASKTPGVNWPNIFAMHMFQICKQSMQIHRAQPTSTAMKTT